jgi:hypothetical protein
MTPRASAPGSIGGVLDAAIGLYRRALSRVWPLTLASAVTAAVPGVFFGLQFADGPESGAQWMLAELGSPTIWLSVALLSSIYLVLYAALISALDGIATRSEASLGDAIATGFSLLGRLFAVSFLLALVIGLGLLLLLVPGLYLLGIYQLAIVALVVERTGILESFSVSARLIKGYWWWSAKVVSVAIVVSMVVSLIGAIVDAVAEHELGAGGWGLVIGQGTATVINVALIPLVPCFLLALYYDLKLRHEGGDAADRVAAIAAG